MNDKSQKLDQAVAQILQRYGADMLRLPGDAHHIRRHAAFSTGYPMLDAALGVGGIPRASLTVFMGHASTGMLTVALRTMANATLHSEMVSYLDLSHSFDADYAAHSGIALANVLLVRPKQPNAMLEVLHTLLQLGGSGLIVVDAVFAGETITPSEAKKLQSLLRRSSTALLILTSPRHHDALIEAADIRLQLERQRWLKRRQTVRGYRTEVRILKNSVAAPTSPVSLAIALSDRDTRV